VPVVGQISVATFDNTVPGGPIGQDIFASPSGIRSTQEITSSLYLPVVANRFFEAYTYSDDFENWGSGWTWGTSPFSYGYFKDGDGLRVYHLRLDDEYELAFVTGPQLEAYALADFEYRASIRRGDELPKYWYDEYGILLSPEPIDPAHPSGAGVYTFYIKLRIDDTLDSFYGISKWDALSRDKRTVLVEQAEGEYITDEAKFWNQFKIVRSGDTLTFFVTREHVTGWKEVYSLTDSSLPFQFYVGFYAMHSKDDFGDYEVEFQFDNVWVDAHL